VWTHLRRASGIWSTGFDETVTGTPPPRRFPWADPEALAPVAVDSGLALDATDRAELAIRAASPEAYVGVGSEHPMALPRASARRIAQGVVVDTVNVRVFE